MSEELCNFRRTDIVEKCQRCSTNREPKENDSSVKEYSINDAIKETGQGKFHFFLLLTCGFILMGANVENVKMCLAMPFIICEFGMGQYMRNILNVVGYIGVLLTATVFGYISDQKGRKRVLQVCTGGTFVFAFLCAFSSNVLTLILFRLSIGIFAAGIQSSSFSYLCEFHCAHRRQRVLYFSAIFLSGSLIVVSLMAWAIFPLISVNIYSGIQIPSWRIYLLATSLLHGINFVLISQFPKSPLFLYLTNRNEDALDTLKQMYAINTGRDPESYPVKCLITHNTSREPIKMHGIYCSLKLLGKHVKSMGKLCILAFVLNGISTGTSLWFPQFLAQMDRSNSLCGAVSKDVTHVYSEVIAEDAEVEFMPYVALQNYSNFMKESATMCDVVHTKTHVYKALLAMGTISVTITMFISVFVNKYNIHKVIAVWILISSIFCTLIPLLSNFYLMVGCFVIFLSSKECTGILIATSSILFPTRIRASALGLLSIFNRFGPLAGSYYIAYMINKHCQLIFHVYSVLILACVLFLLLFKPNSKQSELIKSVRTMQKMYNN